MRSDRIIVLKCIKTDFYFKTIKAIKGLYIYYNYIYYNALRNMTTSLIDFRTKKGKNENTVTFRR